MPGIRNELIGAAQAIAAVALVGGSVAAAKVASTFPLLSGQALRLGVACLLLGSWTKFRGQQLPPPTTTEWGWLVSLGVVGMGGYGVVLVHATAITQPANIGMAIGAAPLLIVLVRNWIARSSPSRRLLAAAVIVAVATGISEVSGTSERVDLVGVFWSVAALCGVASITLLAAPVVDSLGSLAVTVYATGVAAAMLLVAAGIHGMLPGQVFLRRPTGAELGALAYLAVAVTAMVYLIWYAAVRRLGASRAGLFNGLIPLTSLVAVDVVGHGELTPTRMVCALLVLLGVIVGLTARSTVSG